MKLFAFHGNKAFAEAVGDRLGISFSLHEERNFEDGEHKARPLENVRNEEVFVLHSLYGDAEQSVNDKLCRLLFFISALKDASAKKVTAVLPYLCYARKDRRTKSQDPVTTRYVAHLLECSGADAVMTMDVHNLQAYENSFSIPSENLEARKVFADYIAQTCEDEELVVMSPDFGGVKRAEQFLESINRLSVRESGFAVMEKYRSGGKVWGERISGELSGKTVIILDDLISTGGTIARTAAVCKSQGAKRIIAMATHGLFAGQPDETLGEPALEEIVVTNTVPAFRLDHTRVKNKVVVLDVTEVFAGAIQRMHEGKMVSQATEK